MGQRQDLHTKLKTLVSNVYFQPPESMKLTYPCIIYALSQKNTLFANNKLYFKLKRYMVTVIDRNPDTSIPDSLLELPLCSFDRFYIANNLNHYVFSLYF